MPRPTAPQRRPDLLSAVPCSPAPPSPHSPARRSLSDSNRAPLLSHLVRNWPKTWPWTKRHSPQRRPWRKQPDGAGCCVVIHHGALYFPESLHRPALIDNTWGVWTKCPQVERRERCAIAVHWSLQSLKMCAGPLRMAVLQMNIWGANLSLTPGRDNAGNKPLCRASLYLSETHSFFLSLFLSFSLSPFSLSISRYLSWTKPQ